jgi:hypothetical protein
MDWLDPDRVMRSPVVAGAIGSIVALKSSPGSSWPERFFNVLCGALLAGYASPALAEFFGLKTPAMQSGAAFAVGLFGMNLVATAFQWTRDAKLGDWLPWLKKD